MYFKQEVHSNNKSQAYVQYTGSFSKLALETWSKNLEARQFVEIPEGMKNVCSEAFLYHSICLKIKIDTFKIFGGLP